MSRGDWLIMTGLRRTAFAPLPLSWHHFALFNDRRPPRFLHRRFMRDLIP
jgi:hypothetical protein